MDHQSKIIGVIITSERHADCNHRNKKGKVRITVDLRCWTVEDRKLRVKLPPVYVDVIR